MCASEGVSGMIDFFLSFWACYCQKEGEKTACYCTYYSKASGVAHGAG